MCSHIAAFRVQANMRTAMMEHIMKLPLGYVEKEGTGKLRKVVNDSSAATETFLAHNLPDKVVSVATPVGLLVVMFVFDWRLGIASLIPAVLAFIMMGTLMMGPKMAEDMKRNNGFLPGVKPGKDTAEYIDTVMSRITLPGSLAIAFIAIMPALASLLDVQQAFSQFFGGTSLLILVGVVIDSLQQIESHMLMRHYDGLLNSGRTRGGNVAAY